MALLGGPDLTTASARSSLKSISGNSPAMQLAAKHCFILEDPPGDKKEVARSERYVDFLWIFNIVTECILCLTSVRGSQYCC